MTGNPVALTASVLPQAVYATAVPAGAPLASPIYGIEDAKMRLNIEQADAADDVRLQVLVSEVIGEIEHLTGRRMVAESLVAEYGGQACPWRVAEIPRMDVTAITAVTRVAEDGARTAMAAADYAVLWRYGCPVLRVAESADAFAAGAGVVVEIAFTAGLSKDSRAAQTMRAVLHDLVEYGFMDGDERIDPRSKKGFMRAIESLRDNSGERVEVANYA